VRLKSYKSLSPGISYVGKDGGDMRGRRIMLQNLLPDPLQGRENSRLWSRDGASTALQEIIRWPSVDTPLAARDARGMGMLRLGAN
jgi:hypothetical protein